MPTIGDVWAADTWDVDAWATNTWAAAVSGVDFTAQETLTLSAIQRYITPETIVRTVTSRPVLRTTEVE